MKNIYYTSLKLKIAALPEPLRIGIGLGLGFAITLILVVLVMIVGFRYMSNIQTDLEHITQISNVKTELAHTMKYAQRDRSMSLYEISLQTDAFAQDEELRRFDSKGAEWWRAWQALQAMGMNSQELEIAKSINTLAKARNREIIVAVDLAVSKSGRDVIDYMSKITIPGQRDLSESIDKLLRLQQEQAMQAEENAANTYTKGRLILLWLCSLTILFDVFVGVMVIRRVMRQSRELEYKALFDDLTGLPNRALFFDRLGHAVETYSSDKKSFAVVVIDLDRFKEVNDIQGHHVGDLLLKHVARNISVTMRRTDTVARMGGDEFVLLLPGVTTKDVEIIVKKLHSSLCQPVNLEGVVLNVASSMGIAVYPDHDEDMTRLLLKADIAMYAAKRANVGCRVYSPEIETIAARNVELQNELRYAIDHGQLILHYQPKISHNTGSIMGVEALVRWQHPLRGMIPPDDFIPLAEASGLIQPLASWVLQAALEQSVKWHDAGLNFTVSINLSTRNLLDGDLPGRVAKLLAKYQVKAEWIVFEITESAVMAEPEHALETLIKLYEMGIQLSLDDFGTGYSSLAYLKKLPVSEIKIDKSFIKDMERDISDTVIVRSTIALGQNLGMKVVAEGVENAAIWDLLTTLGCDASQGYYMSRPLAAAALEEWMATSDWAKEAVKEVHDTYPTVERRRSLRDTDSH